MPTHVVVDAHNLALDDRGIGRYARAVLVRALADPSVRFTFVVRRAFPRPGPLSRVLEGAPVQVTNRVPRDADVVWFPWNGTFFASDAPVVATVHDVGPFAFAAASPKRRAAEQGPFLRTAAVAQRILVPSKFTAGEVERYLHVDPARIVVTPEAADTAVFAPGPPGSLPDGIRAGRYLLCVGAHDERKNTATLFEAYAEAFSNGDPPLVLTRKPAKIPRGAIVVTVDSDVELVSLYRGAMLALSPSPYEGFGLPTLEALACAAPTLAARGGGLSEIAAGAVAWVDEPFRSDAWASALRDLVADGAVRERLASLGPPRAAQYSWDRCTAQTLAVLREVAET